SPIGGWDADSRPSAARGSHVRSERGSDGSPSEVRGGVSQPPPAAPRHSPVVTADFVTRLRAAVGVVGAAGDRLAAFDQFDAAVVGSFQERDAGAAGVLDRALEQLGAELLEAGDVRFQVLGVEAEVLEAVVGVGVAGAELLVGAGARDVDRHAAVLALAADEAVAEHAGLVADDLEGERLLVPLGGLARVGGLQVNVVDPERHGDLLSGERPCRRGKITAARAPAPRRPRAEATNFSVW